MSGIVDTIRCWRQCPNVERMDRPPRSSLSGQRVCNKAATTRGSFTGCKRRLWHSAGVCCSSVRPCWLSENSAWIRWYIVSLYVHTADINKRYALKRLEGHQVTIYTDWILMCCIVYHVNQCYSNKLFAPLKQLFEITKPTINSKEDCN